MEFKRYTRRVLIGCLSTVVVVCVFNSLVDPYAILGTPRLSGLNEAKPFAGDRGRTTKVYQVLRVRPNGLIVGNSRLEMGLDPNHLCWPQSARPVYNIALPGLSVYGQVRYAQHAMAAGKVSTIVMGLDFSDFLFSSESAVDPHQWPAVQLESKTLLVDGTGLSNPSFSWTQVRDYVLAVLSLDALGHSLITLLHQGASFAETRTQNGFNPADRYYRPIILNEGVGTLFAQKNREVMKRFKGRDWLLYQDSTRWSTGFEAVRQLLRRSRSRGTKVVLFVNPYHAEYLTTIAIAGLWPLFEEWKIRLTEISAAEGGVVLWDFSSFDRFSMEVSDAVAEKGESLSWFWEPAHYRKELGDLMLANIWRTNCPTQDSTKTYGVQIELSNIEEHLDEIRTQRDGYFDTHGSVVARLRRLATAGKGG